MGLCLLAAVSYAFAVVGQKPALRHASALQVTTFGCLVGTVAALPFAGRLVAQVAAAPLSATLTLVYLGVFPTALAFTTRAGTRYVVAPILPAVVRFSAYAQVGNASAVGKTPR